MKLKLLIILLFLLAGCGKEDGNNAENTPGMTQENNNTTVSCTEKFLNQGQNCAYNIVLYNCSDDTNFLQVNNINYYTVLHCGNVNYFCVDNELYSITNETLKCNLYRNKHIEFCTDIIRNKCNNIEN